MKKFRLFFVGFLLIIFVGVVAVSMPSDVVYADGEQAQTTEILASKLSGKTKKLYDAMCQFNEEGGLKTGTGMFDLIQSGFVSNQDIIDYKNGNQSLNEAFELAKAVFELEHPEVFYVDFEKLSLICYQGENGYFAYISSGNNSNYFATNFQSKEDVDAELYLSNENGFNYRVNQLINDLVNFNADDVLKLSRLNNKLNESLSIKTTLNSISAYHLKTAYGAIKEGANSLGIAKLVKVTLDRLGFVNCIVPAFDISGESETEGYFNVVKVVNNYYALNVIGQLCRGEIEEKFLEGQRILYSYTPIMLQNSECVVNYPQIARFDYCEYACDVNVNFNSNTHIVELLVSHQNLSAKKLDESNEEGYSNASRYLAVIFNSDIETYSSESLTVNNSYAMQISKMSGVVDHGNYSIVKIPCENWNNFNVIITNAPADLANGVYSERPIVSEAFTKANTKLESDFIINRYINPLTINPEITSILVKGESKEVFDLSETNSVTLITNEDLTYVDGYDANNINVQIVDEFGENVPYFFVSGVRFDGKNKINCVVNIRQFYTTEPLNFYIIVEGLKKVDSDLPIYAKRVSLQKTKLNVMISNKFFNLSQRNTNVPTIDNEYGLKAAMFTKQGISLDNLQANDLVLKTTETTFPDSMKTFFGWNAIVFDMQLYCGHEPISMATNQLLRIFIPNSFLGDNFSADNITVYRCQHVNGIVDYDHAVPVNSILTVDGVIIETDGFGTFAISPTAQTQRKSIIINQLNVGGEVCFVGQRESQRIFYVGQAEKATICITLNTNYKVEYCILNGEVFKPSSSILNLSYNQLNEVNVFDISFISVSSANFAQENNLTNLASENKLNKKAPSIVVEEEVETRGFLPLAIAGSVIIVSTIIAVVVVILIKRKKFIAVR